MSHTVKAAAQRAGCSESSIRNHIAAGNLPAYHIGLGTRRRSLRITDEALERFIEGRTTSAPSTPSRRRTRPQGIKRYYR